MKPNLVSPSGLPLVVQVAFAGKRRLLDTTRHPAVDPKTFHEALAGQLTERLRRLPSDLGLSPRHAVCALSSLAAGGDLLFTRACAALGWWQRILLPQPREDFLAAGGETGPDFSPDDAAEARRLLASPQVIEERVVSLSADRHTRFEDVNLELVRTCDVLVCLLPAEADDGKRAGTLETLNLAKRWRRPVLELRAGLRDDGTPALTEQWHWPPVKGPMPDPSPKPFAPPVLPAPLDQIHGAAGGLSDAGAYRQTLKDFATEAARKRRRRFKWAALIIVGAHVVATALALLAIKTHGQTALGWLLGVELSFLATGLAYHEWLHRWHAAREWAMARLSAEIARSVIPVAGVPRALRHLFDLPMPDNLRPLLRTLDVLHLAGLRSLTGDWQTRRQAYVADRLRKPGVGQLDYYGKQLESARRWLILARGTFYLGSAGACLATAAKLTLTLEAWHAGPVTHGTAAATLGFLAVLLPVLAVAALSLAAAFDLEARVHTYEEMLAFLQEQTPLLESAATENEFAALALQTETRLLGETANWHARRAYTGVA